MAESKLVAGRLLGVVFVLAVGGLIWALRSPGEAPGGPARTEAGAHVAGATSAPADTVKDAVEEPTAAATAVASLPEASSLEAGQADEPGSRVEVTARRGGLITDAAGVPLAGAQVSWTPASLAVRGARSSPLTFEEWAAASLLATADAGGRYAFEQELPEAGGALWASLPGFLPEGRLLGPPAEVEPGDWDLALQADEPWSLSVVDTQGRSVPGARVVSKDYRGPSFNDRREPEFYTLIQLFMREFVMDEDGRGTASAPVGGVMQAFGEDSASAQKVTAQEHELEFVLGESLAVRGRVTGLAELGPAFVSITSTAEDGRAEVLVALSVLPSGEIQAAEVPRIAEGSYRFQLEGANVLPAALDFPAAELGRELVLNFTAEPARMLDLHITDAVTHLDLEGVFVSSAWPSADGLRLETTVGAARSDALGRVRIPLTDGELPYANFVKQGYLGESIGPFAPDAEPSGPVEIELRPTGRVHGIVRLEGQPVPDFIVAYYEGTGYGQYFEVRVSDQPDGSFTIEGVGAGELGLVATRRGFAQSSPLTVEVEPGATTEVELELTRGGTGRGRVLDAETMLGVPGAGVTRALSSGTQFIGPEPGALTPIEADGSFVLHGLALQRERVVAYADGYVQGEVSASPASDGDYDLGTILLSPARSLLVRVLLPDSISAGEVYYSVSRSFFQGPGLLDENGTVQIAGAKPGIVGISLTLPGGVYVDFDRMLRGAGPWEETFDLRGMATLRVFASDFDQQLLASAWITVARLDDQVRGRGAHRQSVSAAGAAEAGVVVTGLLLGSYSVVLEDAGFRVRSATTTEVTSGETSVTLPAEGEPRAVRVLTPEGDPLEGAVVWIKGPGFGGFLGSARTDASGLALIGGLPDGPATLNIHGGGDSKLDFELDSLGTPEDPTEIVYEASGRLNLRIMDRDVPLEGVLVYADSAVTATPLPWRTVGPGGQLTFEDISEVDYMLRPSAASVWYEEKLVHASAAGKQAVVEFRRIAKLEVTVLDKSGQPMGGVPVTITALESNTNVAEWLADGRASSGSGLVTTADGVVRIEGLPNGPYQVRVGTITQAVTAPALGTGTLTIKLMQ